MRKLRAPRVELRRSIILLSMTLVMALVAVIGPLSKSAFASDATWNGNVLTYEGNQYTTASAPPDRTGQSSEYQWIDTSTRPSTAYVIYFTDGTAPQDSTTATLILYSFNGSSYSQTSSATTIAVTKSLTATAGTTSCGVSGVGWIVCSISNYLSEGIDYIYGIISDFFEVQTINQSSNGIYQLWNLVRNIANVVFTIIFIIIIYSQLTGLGYSNHSIKSMVPRLILGAILVNVSFWICAAAVDASNLLGHSLQALLENIRQNYVSELDISWSTISTAILSGAGLVGVAGFAAAAGGGATSLSFILLTILIPAALSVLAAFIILAARQAIIVVLTTVAPLAFVAFVLPSTKGLFDKWRKLITSMLIIFPAFAMLFGASQIAGMAIIKTAQSAPGSLQLIFILLGLAVQIIPLALTPFLSRLSTGILGQVTNMVNNRQKGLADRAKNWAQDNADMHKSRKLANVASDIERRRNNEYMGRFGALRARGIGRLGYQMDRGKRNRDAHKKQSEELLSNQHAEDWQKRLDSPRQARLGASTLEERTSRQHHQAHTLNKQTETRKAAAEAHHEKEWMEYVSSNNGSEYRGLRTKTAVDKGHAKVLDDYMINADELASQQHIRGKLRTTAIGAAVYASQAKLYQDSITNDAALQFAQSQKTGTLGMIRRESFVAQQKADDITKAMTASDKRVYETSVNEGRQGYLEIRKARVQSIEDNKMAEFQASEVEAEGARQYRELFRDGVAGSHDLRNKNVRIEQMKKETAEIDAILQERADAHWEGKSRRDASLQKLRLQRVVATDEHKKAELQWNKFIEQARLHGGDVENIASGNESLADSLRDLMVNTSVQNSAIENVKDEQKGYILQQLNDRKSLREQAGGGTKYGTTKVRAQAQSGITKMILDNAKDQTKVFSNDGYRVDEMLEAMNENGTLRNGQKSDDVTRFAAIQYVMEDIGNNWAVEKTIDRMIRDNGMVMDKDQNGNILTDAEGRPIYYDARAYNNAMRNGTALPEALSDNEVGSRRDLLQMVVGGYRNGKNKVGWFANTLQESVNRGISMINYADEKKLGREMTTSESAMLTEMRSGKYDAGRIAAMDPDELSRMIQVLRDEKFRGLLNEDQRKNVVDGIVAAQTGIQTRSGIKPRERGLMNIVASYLELGKADNPSGDDLINLENAYYEKTVTDTNGTYTVRVPKGTEGARHVWSAMAAPTEYNMDRQDDIGPSGLGSYGPKERPYEKPDNMAQFD